MPSDLDLILGGAQSATQAYAPYEARRQKGLDDAQPLSPYEKSLGASLSERIQRAQQLVLQGRDPREMAIRVQHGLPLEDVPEMGQQTAQAPQGGAQLQAPATQGPLAPMAPPQASPGGPYGYFPGMGAQYAPAPQPQQASSTPMPTQPQPQGPQNRGDMNALMQAAPFLQRGETAQDRMMLELLKERGRNDRADTADTTKRRGQDVRGNLKAAELSERAREADAKIQLGYDSLEAAKERTSMMLSGLERRAGTKAANDTEIQDLKLRNAKLLAKMRNLAYIMSSINADDPGPVEAVHQLKDEIAQEEEDLQRDIMNHQLKGTTRVPQSDGQAAPVPEGPAEAPINGAPKLNTSTTVKEPTLRTSTTSGGGAVGAAPEGYRATGQKAPAGKADGSYSGGRYQVINGMIYERK